jgi:hypothetical protein
MPSRKRKVLWCCLLLSLSLILPSQRAFSGSDDEAYFKQFLYKEIVDASDPDFPLTSYQWLVAGFPFEVELDATNNLLIQFSILLFPDGKFLARYNDHIQGKGSSSFYPRYCHIIEGEWSVPDANLILKDKQGRLLLEGSRYQNYGQHGILFSVRPGFPETEVRGVSHDFSMVQSEQEPWMMCF